MRNPIAPAYRVCGLFMLRRMKSGINNVLLSCDAGSPAAAGGELARTAEISGICWRDEKCNPRNSMVGKTLNII
jgi:hypothetical protein